MATKSIRITWFSDEESRDAVLNWEDGDMAYVSEDGILYVFVDDAWVAVSLEGHTHA